MIKEVQIKGFQSHTNSIINVSPQLTVITGPSDSGKTAVIRAVRWVVFGEPAGDSFVNKAVGFAEVGITLADGTVVTKRRKGGKTSYTLEVPDKPIAVYDKAEIPEEITAVLGIVKTSFGDFETELNFAYQLAAPFLISEPGSAGAKILGKLSGTEVVDLAIKSVAKENYAANQARLQAVKDIEKTEGTLTLYNDLPQQQEQVKACKTLLDQVDSGTSKLKTLTELRAAYAGVTDKINIHNEVLQRLADVPELRDTVVDLEERFSRFGTLSGLRESLDTANLQIVTWQSQVDKYLLLPEADDHFQKVVYACTCNDVLKKLSCLFDGYLQQIAEARSIIAITENVAQAATKIAQVEMDTERLKQLQYLQKEHTDKAVNIEHCNDLIVITDGVLEVSEKLKAVADSFNRLQQLRILKMRHTVTNDKVTQFVNTLAHTSSVALLTVEPIVEKQARRALLRGMRDAYNSKISLIQQNSAALKRAKEDVAVAQNELHELWNMVGVCPMCGQSIQKGVSG